MPVKYTIDKTKQFWAWLFLRGTRVVEFINAAFLLGFVIPFLYNFDAVLALPSYRKFAVASSALWWILIGALGIAQIIAMAKKSNHSNQISGFILILSGWIWGLVAATFISSVPPLTSAPVIYTIVAVLCLAAGLYLIKCSKLIEDKANGV